MCTRRDEEHRGEDGGEVQIKLSETAEQRLYELHDTLRSQGIHEGKFYVTAISAITDEIGKILIDPFLIAVENTFADLLDEEKEV